MPPINKLRDLVIRIWSKSIIFFRDCDFLLICIFQPEQSNYITFRHGHPSCTSHRVPGPLRHLAWGLYAPEPIVLAIDVPREQKVCLIAKLSIIKEFRFLFDLVLGSPAHVFFALSESFMGTDEDPWSGFSVMKHINWKTQPSAKSLDGLFLTLSNRFSHWIQTDKSFRTQLPARSRFFCLFAELFHWSCSSKIMCPLINLAFSRDGCWSWTSGEILPVLLWTISAPSN